MNTNQSLDSQIYKVGFWSIILAFVMLIISGFFPLDAPGGYSVTNDERIAWLIANSGPFIIGWIIQIVWMTAWCITMFVLAWKIRGGHPIQAIFAAMAVLVSFMGFIIPKFMAIWTIPQLADAISNGGLGSETANSLLLLLNQSFPFTLYASFEYLGFWMYGVFSLLVARPLYQQSQQSVSMKITAVALGTFGILLHCMMVGVFVGIISSNDIHVYVFPFFLIIFLAFGAAAFNFKSAMSSEV